MSHLSQKELDLYAKKILNDYDEKNPGTIFKKKINISNEDALLIQANVCRLRKKRGEKIIGYKIGCVSKDTQKKWDVLNLPGAISGVPNYILTKQYCIRKIILIQQWKQNLELH